MTIEVALANWGKDLKRQKKEDKMRMKKLDNEIDLITKKNKLEKKE